MTSPPGLGVAPRPASYLSGLMADSSTQDARKAPVR